MKIKNNNRVIKKLLSIVTAFAIVVPFTVIGAAAQSAVMGDVNGDGKVTSADAMMTLRYSVKMLSFTADQFKLADVDSNGEVRTSDALSILRYSVGFKDAIPQDPPDDDDTVDPFIEEVVRLINVERAKENLQPLQMDEKLNQAAGVRAEEIITNFDHTRPNGTSCFTVLSEFSIPYMTAGENIAAGQTTPAAVVEGWMNSEGHRDNIMSPAFTKVGVGHSYSRSSRYGHYWTQLFTG